MSSSRESGLPPCKWCAGTGKAWNPVQGIAGLQGIAGSKVPVLNRPGGSVIGEATITEDGKVLMQLDEQSGVELRARLERNEFANVSIGNANEAVPRGH